MLAIKYYFSKSF